MQTISLSGFWDYQTDETDIGKSQAFYKKKLNNSNFKLPGSACENNVGTEPERYDIMTKDAVRSLRQHHIYTGVMWYQREIEIPKEWMNKKIELFMERVMFFSQVWLDENKIGRQQDSLSTPHIYDLTPYASTGKHTLTVRIDNRDLYNIDTMASGYTDDTQSIWNGIVGKIELRAYDAYHISNVQVFPDIHRKNITVKLTINTPLSTPSSKNNATVFLSVADCKGTSTLEKKEYNVTLFHKRQIVTLTYDMGDDVMLWDEFHPNLYELNAELVCEDCRESKTVIFGMREIKAVGREIHVNGKKIFLRGTLDCCVYPKTGYPPTDLDSWLHVCRTLKEYGLNHIRFHSWCPPDAAFAAADLTGIYVLAEMPLWLNLDVCSLATGDDLAHHSYYPAEAERISKCYGNHPSFCMFSNGNELLGDFELLESITTKLKALDSRRLYTLTSNFDRCVTPADDYFSAFRADGHGIRAQYFHKKLPLDTFLAYDDGIQAKDVPVISFEVGQYCVYPDVREIEKFTGNLIPVNFEVIANDLKKKNLLHKVGDFVFASGKLAALLYKEDIEAALRTHDMGGFELLGIHDYPGQCTATIGLLNSFWESKKIISPEEFREFCSPQVPLLKTKRIYENTENFFAQLAFADFGEEKVKNPIYVLDFVSNGEIIYSIETSEYNISFPLGFIKKASMIKAVLSIKNTNIKNSWDIFVYPAGYEKQENKVLIENTLTNAVLDKIKSGGRVAVFADEKSLKKNIHGCFYPVFWSPAYFPSSNPCGFICKNTHPLFEDFPTQSHSNFQWYHILENSVSMDISELPNSFEPIIELVPNFFDNTRMSNIFEARVGKADILVCSFSLNDEFIETRQLKNSIIKYINSENFNPKQTISLSQLQSLFR
ncbi:MAG: glycoside hydrolase family 2 [Clostridia bacterium]|nr:glycoside hydrolase family 2 [Clostridia bacterium]